MDEALWSFGWDIVDCCALGFFLQNNVVWLKCSLGFLIFSLCLLDCVGTLKPERLGESFDSIMFQFCTCVVILR